MEQVGQLLLRGTEAHRPGQGCQGCQKWKLECLTNELRPHDVTEVISGKELLLLSIEQVEADLGGGGAGGCTDGWFMLGVWPRSHVMV